MHCIFTISNIKLPGKSDWWVSEMGRSVRWKQTPRKTITARAYKNTPRKINMEHNHGGLEDHFPFQMGDFVGSMLIFQGVPVWNQFVLSNSTPVTKYIAGWKIHQ